MNIDIRSKLRPSNAEVPSCIIIHSGGDYSNPILTSSARPQSDSLGCGGLSSSLVILKLLPVPLLLRSVGLLFNAELFVLELSLLLVSALDLPLLILALSTYSGMCSVNEGVEVSVVEIGFCCAPGLVSRVGVGEGVISVEGETSTSSASRYHLRRRVYRPQPSWPRRPFCHCGGCQHGIPAKYYSRLAR